MPSYIRSNSNRFYAAIEPSYAVAAQVTSSKRVPATLLRAQQRIEKVRRFDKTGTRTMITANSGRHRTGFELRTSLSSWDGTDQPSSGGFFQAAMGGVPEVGEPVTVAEFIRILEQQTGLVAQVSDGALPDSDMEITYASIDKARRLLGYQPRVSVQEGVKALLEWYQTHVLPTEDQLRLERSSR